MLKKCLWKVNPALVSTLKVNQIYHFKAYILLYNIISIVYCRKHNSFRVIEQNGRKILSLLHFGKNKLKISASFAQ